MVSLRIIDDEFNLLGEIDQYTSLQMNNSWSGIGEVELHVNRYVQYAEHLQMDNIIFPTNRLDRAFVILSREIELNEEGKATENWRITALPIKAYLAKRLVFPALNQSHNVVKASVEDVMYHYVQTEMITPYDEGRIYPNMTVTTSKSRGEIIEKKVRFDGLAELLESLSKNSNFGWNVELDVENKKFVFKVLEGTNRSVNQVDNPPVIFSTEFGTLLNLSFAESKLEYKNVAIVAGQGEGIDRTIVQVGEATGKDRYEVFIDARDVSDTEGEGEEEVARPQADVEAELKERAEEKLEEFKQTIFLEGQALDNSAQQFEHDYFVGDIVTLQDKGWGVTIDVRITSAKEVVEDHRKSIELTYDNDRPTLISKIKKELSNFKNELKR